MRFADPAKKTFVFMKKPSSEHNAAVSLQTVCEQAGVTAIHKHPPFAKPGEVPENIEPSNEQWYYKPSGERDRELLKAAIAATDLDVGWLVGVNKDKVIVPIGLCIYNKIQKVLAAGGLSQTIL